MNTPTLDHVTAPFKRLEDSTPIFVDIYLPPQVPSALEEEPAVRPNKHARLIPMVVYFHPGGLSVGNRRWLPRWLIDRVLSLGYAFASADYQLMPPALGHEIVQDMQDLFTFICDYEVAGAQGQKYKADPDRISVAGSSAGGLCAYLAVMHCVPKPKALLGIYPMGGSFFSPSYLQVKTEVFFMKRAILDPSEFQDFLYPFKGTENGRPTPLSSDSALAYDPETGDPLNRRIYLLRLYLQLGVFLDYFTGEHEPSLSKKLLGILDVGNAEQDPNPIDNFVSAVPEIHRGLFPELSVSSFWPPTMLLHGTADTAVSLNDSHNMRSLLETANVDVDMIEFEGMEHLFDFDAAAEGVWRIQFDFVTNFLCERLGS